MTTIRSLGDMARRDDETQILAEDSEVERIKNYLDHGLVGRFDLGRELEFIRWQKQITIDVRASGSIDEPRYCTEMMVLSGRYLRLMCYWTEMFERYPGAIPCESEVR